MVVKNHMIVESDIPDPNDFVPSQTAVWVNTLWYLSLSLSVAAAMISMLAKQWCYSFVSGRSRQPYAQARLRQRRLDELDCWKMPELLNVLPLLIELSLCKYLSRLVNLTTLTIFKNSLLLARTRCQPFINPQRSRCTGVDCHWTYYCLLLGDNRFNTQV